MSICSIIEPSTSLKNAKIGYKNLLTGSDVVEAKKMLQPNTYERYRPTAGAKTVRFQLASNSTIDFVAIAAHNAGTQDSGVDILIEYAITIGGALTAIDNMQFDETNSALMINFTSIANVAEVAITFNATTLGLELGVIYSGQALEMQRPIYGGHSPIDLSAKTKYQSTMSDSGQFLGRNITRQGTATDFRWRHLTPDWYRSIFQSFVNSAKKTPFFIKWRPDTYEATSYGYTEDDIEPTNMGGNKLMEVSFKMVGHGDTI